MNLQVVDLSLDLKKTLQSEKRIENMQAHLGYRLNVFVALKLAVRLGQTEG